MAKKRRPNGCLIDLGNNRWRPVVTVGYVVNPATGKRKQKQKWYPVFEGGRRAAQKHLDDLNAEVAGGELVLPSRMTVGERFHKWAEEDIAPPATTPNTYRSVRWAGGHIIRGLGHIALQGLSRENVKDFLREMGRALVKRRKKPHVMKRASVRLIRDVLHSFLADEYDAGHVRHNAAAAFRDSKRKRRRREPGRVSLKMLPKPKAWNEEQKNALVTASRRDEQLHALVTLACDAGMRRSELLGTKWDDLHPHPSTWWDKRLPDVTLTVRRQLASSDSDAVDNAAKLDAGEDDTDWRLAMFGQTKSGLERTLDLTPTTVAALHRHYLAQQKFKQANGKAYTDLDLVFAKTVGFKKEEPGRPYPQHVLDREFKKVIAAAKVPVMTFHSTRHTAATLMLLAGVSPVVVAKILGHADVAITMRIYAHCLPKAEKEAAKVRERSFRAAAI
jgi:integrase